MTVAHTTAGYTGSVDQVAYSRMQSLVGARFRVGSATDWQPTVVTGSTRTVQIATGSAVGCGVYDTTAASDTVTFAANSGGTNRYDALVATFDWSAKTVTFGVIQGTTSPPQVNTTTSVVTTKINRLPGVRYDALLAIVQVRPSVGAFTAGDLADCRVYGGFFGMMTVPTAAYISSIDASPGDELYAVDTKLRWRYDGSGWNWPRSAQGQLCRTDFSDTAPTALSGVAAALPAFNVSFPGTIPAGRVIRVSFDANFSSDVAGTSYGFVLIFGGVQHRVYGQSSVSSNTAGSPIGNGWTFNTGSALVNPTGGIPAAGRFGGTGTGYLLTVGIDGPAQFSVADLGAV